MRLPRLPVLAFVALQAQPAAADTANAIRDRMTSLINAGDQVAILKALANPDPASQRQSFAAFQTSRADAASVSAALLAACPDDPRAMLARGWHLQALGWAMRGEAFAGNTYPCAMQRTEAMHAEAFDLALAAASSDPSSRPASDLILSLSRTTGHRDMIADEFDRIMEIWPNRQSLVLAVGGMTPNWGGPPGWGLMPARPVPV